MLRVVRGISGHDGLSLADQFFKYIFPDITGHAKIIDKFLSDERAPIYELSSKKRLSFKMRLMSTPIGWFNSVTFS